MSMTAEKKRFLIEHLGAAEADRIERELAAVEQTLINAGVRHKALDSDSLIMLLEQMRGIVSMLEGLAGEALLQESGGSSDEPLTKAVARNRHPASAYVSDLRKGAVRG